MKFIKLTIMMFFVASSLWAGNEPAKKCQIRADVGEYERSICQNGTRKFSVTYFKKVGSDPWQQVGSVFNSIITTPETKTLGPGKLSWTWSHCGKSLIVEVPFIVVGEHEFQTTSITDPEFTEKPKDIFAVRRVLVSNHHLMGLSYKYYAGTLKWSNYTEQYKQPKTSVCGGKITLTSSDTYSVGTDESLELAIGNKVAVGGDVGVISSEVYVESRAAVKIYKGTVRGEAIQLVGEWQKANRFLRVTLTLPKRKAELFLSKKWQTVNGVVHDLEENLNTKLVFPNAEYGLEAGMGVKIEEKCCEETYNP